jgi:hypothetical protein
MSIVAFEQESTAADADDRSGKPDEWLMLTRQCGIAHSFERTRIMQGA